MDKINLGAFKNAYFFNTQSTNGKLLLGLHGRGDNAQSFCGVRHGLRLKNFDQLYVNAPDEWNLAFSRGYSWYAMAPDQLPGIQRSYELLEELVTLLEQRGYARQNIVLFGFSQGCLMSLELAVRSQQAFMGVIGISGTVYNAAALIARSGSGGRATPYFLTHGYDDEILPYKLSSEAYTTLSTQLKFFEFKSLPKAHNIADVEWEWYQSRIMQWSKGIQK